MYPTEDQTPLLSIIVPVYNAEKYLSRCLNSILSQQTSSFEALCVDDGSKDRSGQILDEYARLDSRIKVFHIENHGVSFARNYALKKAIGVYIGFVDSDDWIDSDHFSGLIQYFEDSTVDWVVSPIWYERLGSNLNCKETKIPNSSKLKELTRKETFEALIFDSDICGYCPSKIFRREKIKFNFNEQLALAEDMLFCCQYAYGIQKTILVNRRTYHYLLSDSSSTNMFRSTSRITGLRAEMLVADLLSNDDELAVCRDRITYTLLNWYFIFFYHYSQIDRQKKVLSLIKEYRPEIRKYLRLFCSSRNYGVISKMTLVVKVYVPYLWIFVRRIFKK